MQIQAATTYKLPADTYKDWHGCERSDYVPTPRQQQVIDAVQKALDAGCFFTRDVLDFCVKELQVSEEQAAVAVSRVQGGEAGMDFYYARKYLDKQRELQKAREVLKLLQPYVGQQLGVIVFPDFKRITGATITEVSDGGLTMTVQGKRGSATVAFSCNPLSVANAIDRAVSRDLRKLNFLASYGAKTAAAEVPAPVKVKASVDEMTASLF